MSSRHWKFGALGRWGNSKLVIQVLIFLCVLLTSALGFASGSEVKLPACNLGDLGSIPGLGRFPGEGKGNPLQYSSLEHPMDRGALWATVHGITKSQTH